MISWFKKNILQFGLGIAVGYLVGSGKHKDLINSAKNLINRNGGGSEDES